MHFARESRPAVVASGTATAVGGRADNQDRAAASSWWAVVSDGVGGHAGGDRAAELTVAAVVATVDPVAAGAGGSAGAGGGGGTGGEGGAATATGDRTGPGDHTGAGGRGAVDERLVQAAVDAANDAVRAGRLADPSVAAMGATVTIAVARSIRPDESWWLVSSAGDSPAWRVTTAEATQLTRDHTLAAELLRTGAITPEEAATHPGRNVIVRSIGPEEQVDADTTAVALAPGEALVLASDGLTDVMDAADVHEIVTATPGASEAAQRLVDEAVRRGTTDNVTVAVLRHVAVSGHGEG
jgi:PPM family protein phosphatase